MDIITFGKYKNCKIQDILEKDPSYLLWADKNVNFFSLNDDQRKKCVENQKTKKISFDPDYLHWDEEGNPISCFGEFCDEMSFNEGAFGTDW